MNQMQDMVAIVTGASRGLGKAIALEYASEEPKSSFAPARPLQQAWLAPWMKPRRPSATLAAKSSR